MSDQVGNPKDRFSHNELISLQGVKTAMDSLVELTLLNCDGKYIYMAKLVNCCSFHELGL